MPPRRWRPLTRSNHPRDARPSPSVEPRPTAQGRPPGASASAGACAPGLALRAARPQPACPNLRGTGLRRAVLRGSRARAPRLSSTACRERWVKPPAARPCQRSCCDRRRDRHLVPCPRFRVQETAPPSAGGASRIPPRAAICDGATSRLIQRRTTAAARPPSCCRHTVSPKNQACPPLRRALPCPWPASRRKRACTEPARPRAPRMTNRGKARTADPIPARPIRRTARDKAQAIYPLKHNEGFRSETVSVPTGTGYAASDCPSGPNSAPRLPAAGYAPGCRWRGGW